MLLLCCEAVVCTAPVGILWFFGVLLSPFWAGALAAYLSGAPIYDEEGLLPWILALLLVMVVCGFLGLFGLISLLYTIGRGERRTLVQSRVTLAAVSAGVLSVLLFNVYQTTDQLWEVVLFIILPLGSCAHILYSARRLLVMRRPTARGA